jgi:hypothetical protein
MLHENSNFGLLKRTGKEIQFIDDEIRSTCGPYFISSFSLDFNPKLFILFGYNACVVIKNGEEYKHNIDRNIHKYDPEAITHWEIVKYFDEYKSFALGAKTHLMFKKKYIYQYEKEYRLVLFYENLKKHSEPEVIILNKSFDVNYECLYTI